MTTPMHNQLEAALTELREQQEKIRTFNETHKQQRTTVLSKNRMVSVTVDSAGKLTELSFKGNRYRNLAPAELASVIVDTITRAQQGAETAVRGAAEGLLPQNRGFDGLFGKGLSFDELFDEAVKLAGQPFFEDDRTVGREGKGNGSAHSG